MGMVALFAVVTKAAVAGFRHLLPELVKGRALPKSWSSDGGDSDAGGDDGNGEIVCSGEDGGSGGGDDGNGGIICRGDDGGNGGGEDGNGGIVCCDDKGSSSSGIIV
ncbi:hypothetical protein ACOSQ3_013881 [Xanthoceras sorbifolium]